MKTKKTLGIAALLALLPLANSCNLDEELNSTAPATGSTSTTANTASLLNGVYIAMRDPFQGAANVFALSEVSTDERIMPTRGPDWDDNGKWRQLHLHTWDANNEQIRNSFNGLGGVVFAATDMLRFNPSPQQDAEARFLRAWANYWTLDMFDQVPYRDPGELVTSNARVRKGTEALDYIISELNAIIPNLADAPKTRATKDAARGLLMKCYLNRGVYANRAAPTFAPADMNLVIQLADQIIAGNRYTFAANYFDNFAPANGTIGTENIFTNENIGGSSSGSMRDLWRFTSHYNMNPSGYNGPAVPAEFYNKFEANDKRRGTAYKYTGQGVNVNPGNRINVGFLVGQQYNLATDAPLETRTRGERLIFTPTVSIIETGSNLESTGIRVFKYAPDVPNDPSALTDNDMVHLRLPDILLMKAEAILRGGTATNAGPYGGTALALVNSIRTHPSRGASALTSLTLDALLDERGRELYLELWRRQDLIRFGKFLAPSDVRTQASASTYLIFPIPNQQLAVNPNITQNPGY
ncbi:RagB/SusD family nutrient uptake outer membrane protein [Hymenobacter jejuensis]|uniref:RagB/SusD family nutrient uptake outer membrane protein n=1 Tax=Hymenobacter jejuensis TaxID=2502781 RepID=A0A5B7ZYA0_9BACT|nr:RagB/SusD family nutrient uptake outer membrane protein [Hymenobacter jejuensis]QDA58802.1 RagB/SusD family nutrient uptake outer membrane protein [Hymenobacter jejuensis]